MKSTSIKCNIILNFFISGIQAFILTVVIFISGFICLHIISKNLYVDFANAYNSSPTIMFIFMLVIFLIFIVLMTLIFIKRMNKITDYIEEISKTLKLIAVGNMDVNIPIRTENELGVLAGTVNKMAYDLKQLIIKEREWDKQKNNLITNLSHDLRTPLTSILGFLELIEKGNYNENKLNHYLKILLDKAKELKVSIDQLFEFAKINNSDLKLNKSKICIEQLLEQVTMGFIPDLEENNMEYRIKSKDKGLIINADAILLARAFENIISNSIKYGSKGRYLDINIEREDNNVLVKLINYGEKIKEEDLKVLFQKFYRAEKSCNKKEGTGLGLAIVKTVVELHNGDICINSSTERTQFELKFPIN